MNSGFFDLVGANIFVKCLAPRKYHLTRMRAGGLQFVLEIMCNIFESRWFEQGSYVGWVAPMAFLIPHPLSEFFRVTQHDALFAFVSCSCYCGPFHRLCDHTLTQAQSAFVNHVH